MTFEETRRVTVRVGVSTLPLWERAARKSLAWNLQDWIAAVCNKAAREILADELAAESRRLDRAAGIPRALRAAGPVAVRKGGKR